MKQKTSRVQNQDWESHLIRRARAGESVAFELLVDLYRPTLEALAHRMLRNRDDANDAVQESFVKAFRAIHEFDPRRPLRPWLCRICANCCVDIVRSRKRDGEPLETHEYMLADPKGDLNEQTYETMQGEAVREAVTNLPERYREIVVMRHYRHMDVIEIAEALDKPEGTVKSWLFRARALLKRELSAALATG